MTVTSQFQRSCKVDWRGGIVDPESMKVLYQSASPFEDYLLSALDAAHYDAAKGFLTVVPRLSRLQEQ